MSAVQVSNVISIVRVDNRSAHATPSITNAQLAVIDAARAYIWQFQHAAPDSDERTGAHIALERAVAELERGGAI